MEDLKELKKKVDVYYSNKVYTFIKKENGTFLNGYINKIEQDFFVIFDDVLGEYPIMFSEIVKIDVSMKNKNKESCENELG